MRKIIILLVLSLNISVVMADTFNFEEFNLFLGIAPISQTLNQLSKGGSYAAKVTDANLFSKICPEIQHGTRVFLYRFDHEEWIVKILEMETRFRLLDTGISPESNNRYQIKKISGSCPQKTSTKKALTNDIDKKTNTTQPSHTIPGTKLPKTMLNLSELDEVLFDYNKADIKPQFYQVLENLVSELNENKKMTLEIHGHTCVIGTEKYNIALSKKRAYAVANYLIKKGIASNRLKVKWFGYTKPRQSNGTEYGRAVNRRVEFVKKK